MKYVFNPLTGNLDAVKKDLTGAEIKSLYEAEADTNAFTDDEKDKLSGVEDGATGDQTASEILTSIKAVDGAGSELDADTLDGQEGIFYQDRVNHTGTQAISTVSGLQTALDGKEPADATILKDADIGVTVQGYNANTVIDASYVHTDNNYTTTEKNKLAGIETSATADQTGAEIKALYEAQPDTNAYTDTELAKVASLYYLPTDIKTADYTASNGEEVRCDTTAGAFSVTLPATGALRIVDVGGTDYTSGFGANHLTILPTGGDTIVGEASLELDVGLTSVTLLRIGTDWTVVDLDGAAFRVIDWGEITNKPTLATAAQGTLADTALQPTETEIISGNYSFNGALILPNNSRINGVEHFYQTTKPTVRGDSSALVAGDRWWKIDDGSEWFWNGTYWLSATRHLAIGYGMASFTNSLIAVNGDIRIPAGGYVFVEEAFMVWDYTGYSVNDYWQLQVSIMTIPNASILVIATYTTTTGTGRYTETPNALFGGNTRDAVGIRVWTLKVGAPGTIMFAEGLYYREVIL